MKIKSIKPFKKEGYPDFWFFTDKKKGFENQMLLFGFSEILTDLVNTHIKGDVQDFHLLMSEEEFPGYQSVLNGEATPTGPWYVYKSINGEMIGTSIKDWLSKYFDKNPDEIFLRVENRVKW